MKHIVKVIEQGKETLKRYFIADESEPAVVRRKHLRLGLVVFCAFTMSSYLLLDNINNKRVKKPIKQEVAEGIVTKKIDIKELVKGVSNENIWLEGAEKKLEEVKQEQLDSKQKQGNFQDYINKEKVGKAELIEIMKKFESEMEEKYNEKLAAEINKVKEESENKAVENSLESQSYTKKRKKKKVGDYLPAGSRVQAIITSGVDAGVGASAQADPREVLLRITGNIISAGMGEEYTVSPKLMGCTLLCEATGDISSEKVYLKPVVITCRDKSNYIERAIKGYISANGKSGIRGEVISREGDLVLNSFLSGLTGGFGNGIAQYSQPGFSVTPGGLLETGAQKAKNITTRGFGSGLGNSGTILSEYFIKRAEQYQPVISINEGIEVHLVLKEGFSLTEEDGEKNG
jgi:conjugal transfer pilus assembly protein TraB